MRILLLSDISSEHTEKWAIGLAEKGIEVGIFSLKKPVYDWFSKYNNIHYLNPHREVKGNTLYSKIGYLKVIPFLKRVIKEFAPDIVHAHYATSYGLLANLSGFRPYFISAWGTDVMKFPQQNFINKAVLKNNLAKATVVCATSTTIKEYIHKVLKCNVEVIPFGVDLNKFKPNSHKTKKNTLVISYIKPLEKIYCIDIVIEAFSLIVKKNPQISLKLMIVGPGSELNHLKQLTEKLSISKHVEFTGRIDYSEIQDYFNMTDVFINISEYESFGVSVIEAMACEKAVIVSDTGGLKEIVDDGINGIKVPIKNIRATADAMEKLIQSKELREKMGIEGRKKVERLYRWEDNLQQMIALYSNALKK